MPNEIKTKKEFINEISNFIDNLNKKFTGKVTLKKTDEEISNQRKKDLAIINEELNILLQKIKMDLKKLSVGLTSKDFSPVIKKLKDEKFSKLRFLLLLNFSNKKAAELSDKMAEILITDLCGKPIYNLMIALKKIENIPQIHNFFKTYKEVVNGSYKGEFEKYLINNAGKIFKKIKDEFIKTYEYQVGLILELIENQGKSSNLTFFPSKIKNKSFVTKTKEEIINDLKDTLSVLKEKAIPSPTATDVYVRMDMLAILNFFSAYNNFIYSGLEVDNEKKFTVIEAQKFFGITQNYFKGTTAYDAIQYFQNVDNILLVKNDYKRRSMPIMSSSM